MKRHRLCWSFIKDLGIQQGEKVLLLINGSGATTLMEQLIVYRNAAIISGKRYEIVGNHVGELLTVQEQAGFQMCMVRMDDELLSYWNAPCRTPYFKM